MNFPIKQDRRYQSRAECNLTAKIHTGSSSFEGLVKNVSDSGAFFWSPQKLLPGECVCIAIEPPYCGPLVIEAQVVWSRIFRQDEPGGLYGMGFRFIDVRLTQITTSP